MKRSLKTKAGQSELKEKLQFLRLEKKRRKTEYKSLTPYQKKRRDVEDIFRRYDADRSGEIDRNEFSTKLNHIATNCISNRNEIQSLYAWI